MKLLKNKKIILIILFTLWFLAISFYLGKTLFLSSYAETLFRNEIVENIPAGEIVKGFKIEQPIYLPEEIENEDICISILMATYRRRNESQVEVSLEQKGHKNRIILYTKYIDDNSYQKICFSNDNYEPGPAFIKITGIDGSRGNAITVWLTKDTPHGEAIINGVPQEYSLVFKIGKSIGNLWNQPGEIKYALIVFMTTFIILMAALTLFYIKENNLK